MNYMGYSSAMDRGYNAAHESEHDHGGHDHNHGSEGFSVPNSTNDLGLGISDLGFSFSLGPVPNVQAIAAKIRPGSKRIELAFTGTGKGTGQSQTPEYYGEQQRQALREISEANEVHFTTHSALGIAGLAGMDQQGNFSKASKNFSLQEVKRAIEFASDVGRGGSVVVHTGEFQRPIVDSDWNQTGEFAGKFRQFEDESERSSYKVIDTRTGSVIQEARKSKRVARPVWKKYQEGDDQWDEREGGTYKDEHGNSVQQGDYIDYFGNKLEMKDRVPVFNKELDRFEVKQMDWNDMKDEAKELTERARKFWRENKGKNGGAWETEIWKRFQNANSEDEIEIRPEEAFIIATLETNAAHSRGWAYQYGGSFDEDVERMKKMKKALVSYKKIEEETDPEEQWRLKKEARTQYGDIVPDDAKLPSELVEQAMRRISNNMAQSREAASSQWAQAEEAMEQIRNVESAETYALKEACDAYADLGISAMRRSDRLEEQGKMRKPIQVAMENLFPEQYGAHPEELIKLVKQSRGVMERKLVQLGVSKDKAKRESQEHITSTFDMGHLNTWRKYWQGDPHKSIGQNDKDFDDWAVKMVDKMSKENIIGHVHIDDNYGYHDDHLAPGEGNTPLKRMIKVLKENGYKGEMIVEPGADFTTDTSGFKSVMKAWRHFDIPFTGTGVGSGGGASKTWNQVGYGWAGQVQTPYFTFGGYSPTEEWTLWSGVPLE